MIQTARGRSINMHRFNRKGMACSEPGWGSNSLRIDVELRETKLWQTIESNRGP